MNKKIFGGIAVLVIASAMALSVSFSAKNDNLSDISLANVEALARIEINNPGTYTVRVYSLIEWYCDDGGKSCCPDKKTGNC